MNAFEEPYRVLRKIYAEGARLKLALADTPLGERRGRTVKTVYGVLENDGYLEFCVRTFAEKPPKAAVKLVLKIALYAILFLDMPKAAATSEAVGLVKLLGKGGAAGFVNAFLRAFEQEKVVLPEGIEGLIIRSNFPRFAVEEICDRYGDRAEAILTARSRGVSVRFRESIGEYAALPYQETTFKNVYLFPNFTRDEGFFQGKYTFQSLGSVAICDVVEPCGELLDACAAPGGKSVLLAEQCGRVTACELHAHRVKLIKDYCARMGAKNVTAMQADSAVFRPEFGKRFDGVLCDVPCSGLGTASENPDLPLNKRAEDIIELNRIQAEILENCARYVQCGGFLVYSTCSILKAENDDMVGAFLVKHGEFTVEEITSPLPFERTAYGLQFLPDTAFGAGFYVCKLRRAL